MAFFCDSNFKQFGGLYNLEMYSKGLSYQCSTSGLVVCGPGPYLLSFPNEAKVTDSNHYLRL